MQTNNQQLAAMLAAMSPTDRDAFMAEALERAKIKAQAKAQPNTLTDFKRRFWRDYQHAAHQQSIDIVLQQVAAYVLSGGKQGLGRAMIEMPPRHGKTRTTAEMFPAWMLSQKPDLGVILTCYGASLAYRSSKNVRRILLRTEYRESFPETRFAGGKVSSWQTTEDGGLVAAGVGGPITGEGARLIIVDDAVKSRAEAESPTRRASLQDWYQNDLLSRLEDGGAIVVMGTRYHTDDLQGFLLSDENEDDENWHVLRLPALAEENDPLGREPGAALWPERYPVEWMEKRRRAVGEYAFASLYQQQPITKEASLFDTGLIQIVDTIPELKQVVRFYDLAVSSKTTADYTAGVKLGLKPDGSYIVLDVYRRQAAPTATAEAIVSHAHRDGTNCAIRLEATNDAIVQLDFLLRDERLKAYTIDAKRPEGDKYTRATPAASRVNAGQVSMLRGAWNRAFLDELSVFPSRAHDDQVDGFSGAYSMLTPYNDGSIRIEYYGPGDPLYEVFMGRGVINSGTGRRRSFPEDF